jgi:hypothetical protein
MSEENPTLTEICAGVWTAAGRTLTGASGGIPVVTPLAAADIYATVFQGGTLRFLAHVLLNGADIHQADIATLTYSVFRLRCNGDRAAVDGFAALPLAPADVVFDTLQTDAEASAYNFCHVVPINGNAPFDQAGDVYLVEYSIVPVSGQKVIVRFRVSVI